MLASWCLVGIAGSKVGLRTNNNKRPRPPFSSPFLTTPIVPSLCRTNQTRHTALKKYLYKRPPGHQRYHQEEDLLWLGVSPVLGLISRAGCRDP